MIKSNVMLDAKGLACPMPIVKTKKAINELGAGEVIEVQATDKGSKADMKAWATSSGHHYLGTIEESGVLKHYIRKATAEEKKIEKHHPDVISNEELLLEMERQTEVFLLDVRESAEYEFGHIPGAVSIPLGELNDRLNELKTDLSVYVYVVCRTGNRSDLAAQKLTEAGFKNVINVVPGMSEWKGPITKLEG
ncbi:sulfurtransferase TusA family protein [Fictibacillus enclensis]|uniref:sulfurtransferase TusA family protein n=1 Tax=Fictibacillus enclensis TaxID=1017270 RepID=UPI0025A1812B|nr:sulfurtransferase TusA family protein [Fictibacillus enclensis]MDM5197632.1 sulfurtransferase TusA family protein [Fictibacillus enclensis]